MQTSASGSKRAASRRRNWKATEREEPGADSCANIDHEGGFRPSREGAEAGNSASGLQPLPLRQQPCDVLGELQKSAATQHCRQARRCRCIIKQWTDHSFPSGVAHPQCPALPQETRPMVATLTELGRRSDSIAISIAAMEDKFVLYRSELIPHSLCTPCHSALAQNM
jgi:hypothetical protein